MNTLDLYRAGSFFSTIKLGPQSVQLKEVMGENSLSLNFELSSYLEILVNDYCDAFDERYVVNSFPIIKKLGSNRFEYNLTMTGVEATLARAQCFFLGQNNTLKEPDFSLTGKAIDFLSLILANANRIDPGWTLGEVTNTSYKTLTFQNENCYNVLSRVAEEFETEFFFNGKQINLAKKEQDTSHFFRVGKFRGLYDLTRSNIDSTSVITRLYAYGANKNLPAVYNGKRLHLPSGYNPNLVSDVLVTSNDLADGTKDLIFTWSAPTSVDVTHINVEVVDFYGVNSFITVPYTATGATVNVQVNPGRPNYSVVIRSVGGANVNNVVGFDFSQDFSTPLFPQANAIYVEKNTDLYGVIEATQVYEDIFPHRTGTVTSVDVTNIYVVVDSTLDFNINDQILGGLKPKISFKTGQLAGYTFDIASYDDSTKTIVILPNKEETSLDLPSSLMKPGIGDEYVLIDLNMPQAYIDAAEATLLAKANEVINLVSSPQISYQLTLDPNVVRDLSFNLGDLITVQDDHFNINQKIRITSFTRNLVYENIYESIKLSDQVKPGTIQTIVNSISNTSRQVSSVASQVQNNSMLNNRVIGTLAFIQIPTTNTETGFSHALINDQTGELYKKV